MATTTQSNPVFDRIKQDIGQNDAQASPLGCEPLFEVLAPQVEAVQQFACKERLGPLQGVAGVLGCKLLEDQGIDRNRPEIGGDRVALGRYEPALDIAEGIAQLVEADR